MDPKDTTAPIRFDPTAVWRLKRQRLAMIDHELATLKAERQLIHDWLNLHLHDHLCENCRNWLQEYRMDCGVCDGQGVFWPDAPPQGGV